jgi:hypothetical protein
MSIICPILRTVTLHSRMRWKIVCLATSSEIMGLNGTCHIRKRCSVGNEKHAQRKGNLHQLILIVHSSRLLTQASTKFMMIIVLKNVVYEDFLFVISLSILNKLMINKKPPHTQCMRIASRQWLQFLA